MIHDISAPLRPDLPHWPGETGLRRQVLSDLASGDTATVSELCLGAHTGTHIDAPSHFLVDAGGIETVPVDALVGPALVIGLEDLSGPITAAELARAGIPAGTERLLVKTSNSGWSTRDDRFRENFIAFDPTAASWCVDRGIRLLGIDYLSIEPFGSGKVGHPVHKLLLRAGVVILEGLDLDRVPAGPYLLAALPLRVPGAEAAPTRAVLLEEWMSDEPRRLPPSAT